MQKTTLIPVLFANLIKFCIFLTPLVIPNATLSIIQNPLSVTEWICLSTCIIDVLTFLFFSKVKFQFRMFIGGVILNIISLLIFHTIIILYGAPVIESASETFHLALLLTSLSSVPCSLAFSLRMYPWIQLVSIIQSYDTPYEISALITATSSVIGAWFGAIPIPLDWDRPWQVWPISCLVGTCIGHLVGLTISSLYLTLTKSDDSKSKLG